MAPFNGWGSNASRLEPIRGGNLLITTKFPKIPGNHFIYLRRLSQPWSHPVVLNMGPQDWESSALNTRPSLLSCFQSDDNTCASTNHFCDIKGYVHYKTITSQNVLSEAQIKNFFISQKNYIPFSRYSSFFIFNHFMIYQISDIMMSIST